MSDIANSKYIHNTLSLHSPFFFNASHCVNAFQKVVSIKASYGFLKLSNFGLPAGQRPHLTRQKLKPVYPAIQTIANLLARVTRRDKSTVV